MTIGKRIKEVRTLYNYSQRQLGKVIGVSKTMIYQLEKDLRLPSITTLVKISKIFDVPISYFLMTDEQLENARKKIHEK